jgi:hypothetical protein
VGGGSAGGAGGGTGGGAAGGAGGGAAGGAGGGTATGDGGIGLPDGGVVSAGMGFFVTSRGTGTGGDMRGDAGDGLVGADRFCTTLATAISPALGAKTWRAYLSTTTVNARSRIGMGPWLNAKGVQIAANLAQLHDDAGINLLNFANTLDERGLPVPIAGPNVHDILSGTEQDGTVATGANCTNWTSNATNVTARVGHSNRAGGGAAPTSWQAAHSSGGCAAPGTGPGGSNTGTVASGGGRGSYYCFSAD